MVLALGVMIEEAGDNGWSHSLADGSHCKNLEHPDMYEDHESFQDRKKTCETLIKADKWFYVMLFTSDIVLVVSIIALFAMFAEWMVFTASVSNGLLVITEFSLMEILSENLYKIAPHPIIPPPTNYPPHPQSFFQPICP